MVTQSAVCAAGAARSIDTLICRRRVRAPYVSVSLCLIGDPDDHHRAHRFRATIARAIYIYLSPNVAITLAN